MHYESIPPAARWFLIGFGVACLGAPFMWYMARAPLLRASEQLRIQVEAHVEETSMVRSELRELEGSERRARDEATRLMRALDDLPRPIFRDPPPPAPSPPSVKVEAPARVDARMRAYNVALRDALVERDEAIDVFRARDAIQTDIATHLRASLDAATTRADRAEARLMETEDVLASAVRAPAPRRWGVAITCGVGAAGASGIAPACALGVSLRVW